MDGLLTAFSQINIVLSELRKKCHWDRKQTIHTLCLLSIEEIYELVDAINNEDWSNIKEELGDVLLHILFYTKIAEEESKFTLEEMILAQIEKLKLRHPHIYGDLVFNTEEEVKKNWEKIKLNSGKKSILEGVPIGLPSVVKAFRLQDKTAQVGFEWDKMSDVWDKVLEEIGELNSAILNNPRDNAKISGELGDCLFSLVNLARYLKIDPEAALQQTNQKFKNRFQYIEHKAVKPLDQMSLAEMDDLWNQAKLLF